MKRKSISVFLSGKGAYLIDQNGCVTFAGCRKDDIDALADHLGRYSSASVFVDSGEEVFERACFNSLNFFDRKRVLRHALKKLGINSKYISHCFRKGDKKDKCANVLEIRHVGNYAPLERLVSAAERAGVILSVYSLDLAWRQYLLSRKIIRRGKGAAWTLVLYRSTLGHKAILFDEYGGTRVSLSMEAAEGQKESFSDVASRVLRYIKSHHRDISLLNVHFFVSPDDQIVGGWEGIKELCDSSGLPVGAVELHSVDEELNLIRGKRPPCHQDDEEEPRRHLFPDVLPIVIWHRKHGIARLFPGECDGKYHLAVFKNAARAKFIHDLMFVVALASLASLSSFISYTWLNISALSEEGVRLTRDAEELERLANRLREEVKIPYRTSDINHILDFVSRFDQKKEVLRYESALRAVGMGMEMMKKAVPGNEVEMLSYSLSRKHDNGEFLSSRYFLEMSLEATSSTGTLTEKNRIAAAVIDALSSAPCVEEARLEEIFNSSPDGSLSLSEDAFLKNRFSLSVSADIEISNRCLLRLKGHQSHQSPHG